MHLLLCEVHHGTAYHKPAVAVLPALWTQVDAPPHPKQQLRLAAQHVSPRILARSPQDLLQLLCSLLGGQIREYRCGWMA